MVTKKLVPLLKLTFLLLALAFVSNVIIYPSIIVVPGECKENEVQLARDFEILSYPVKIIGAANLVSILRKGHNASVRPPLPSNLHYKRINFLPGTMRPCNSRRDGRVDILIIVKSAIQNLPLRMQQRSMWANKTYLNKFSERIKYGFILGQGVNPSVNISSGVMEEAKQHGDIILGDFVDEYRNLTHKTMAGFRWALENCPQFRYFVSLDDDNMLSIPNLIKYMKDPYNYPNINSSDLPALGKIVPHTQNFYSGSLFVGNLVIRDAKSRYYVAPEAYPFRTFPPHMSGFITMLTKETVSSFFHISSYVEHITVDDAFLGILANELRIKPVHIRGYATSGHPKPEALIENSTLAKDCISMCCFMSLEKFKIIWDDLYRSSMLSNNDVVKKLM